MYRKIQTSLGQNSLTYTTFFCYLIRKRSISANVLVNGSSLCRLQTSFVHHIILHESKGFENYIDKQILNLLTPQFYI